MLEYLRLSLKNILLLHSIFCNTNQLEDYEL